MYQNLSGSFERGIDSRRLRVNNDGAIFITTFAIFRELRRIDAPQDSRLLVFDEQVREVSLYCAATTPFFPRRSVRQQIESLLFLDPLNPRVLIIIGQDRVFQISGLGSQLLSEAKYFFISS